MLLRTNFDIVDMHSETAATLELQNASAAPPASKDAHKTIELPNNAVLTNITVIRSRGGSNDLLPLTTLTVKQRDGSLVVPVKDAVGIRSDDGLDERQHRRRGERDRVHPAGRPRAGREQPLLQLHVHLQRPGRLDLREVQHRRGSRDRGSTPSPSRAAASASA